MNWVPFWCAVGLAACAAVSVGLATDSAQLGVAVFCGLWFFRMLQEAQR